MTNSWDAQLADKLNIGAKTNFKAMKGENRPRRVIRFMAEQRGLFYDLRDANATVGKAYDQVSHTNTMLA